MNTNDRRQKIQECFRASDDIGIMAVAQEALDVVDAQAQEIEGYREALEHIANDKPARNYPALTIDYQHLKRIAADALAKQEPAYEL
jgi:hypothetical protein